MRVCVDTNVLVRAAVQDDPVQAGTLEEPRRPGADRPAADNDGIHRASAVHGTDADID